MKRMGKSYARGVVLLAAAVLVFAAAAVAAGCGSSSGTSTDSSGNKQIVIGVDASMSGPLAGFGAFEKWAVETAVSDQNAKGGVTVDGGKATIKVVLLDDKSDANTASSNVDTLINKDGAIAIIGPVTPTVGNPAALAAEKSGIPYLETGNPLEPFMAVKQWQNAFDFFVSGVELGNDNFQVMTDLGLKAKTNSIVATCVDNSPDGPVFDAMWTAAAKKYGWKQVKMPPYPSTATEFSSLIAKLKQSNADYVIALGDTPQLVALRKQMDAAGYKPKILDFARGAQLQQFADSLGPLSNGVFIESYWLPALPYPGAAEVGKRYTTETGQSMGQILGPEYAAAQIMMDAINRAGTTDPQKIVAAIAATDGDFVCGPVKFDAKHTSAIPVIWTQWQDQKSVIVWPSDVANGKPIFPLP
ncbi:MAG TPA: amino acid ABC transporter substrate-binding protein [Thermoleophilia bacterium]|nr:amino acid ABC transporter substrate-binding protein [Thermoleophilia bacterium]